MRKGRDGGKREKKTGKKKTGKKREKKKKRRMKIVATTSLPAVNHLNADRWNAARSRQYANWPFVSFQSKIPPPPKKSRIIIKTAFTERK